MTWIIDNTFPHLPDMQLVGIDHNGTERQVGVSAGRLVGDPATLIRLQWMIDRGESVRLGAEDEEHPAGLGETRQAYLSLRALFQRLTREQVPDDVFAAP